MRTVTVGVWWVWAALALSLALILPGASYVLLVPVKVVCFLRIVGRLEQRDREPLISVCGTLLRRSSPG